MVIIDEPFPDCIAFGARSEPGWSTELAATASGIEDTNQQWQHTKHSYDASPAIRVASEYSLVRTHFHMCRGRAKGFLFKDYLDFSATSLEGVTEEAADSSSAWQLFKRYGSGVDLYDRKITRPVTGSLTIYRTRGMSTTDVTGSSTVDYDTGTFIVSGDVPGDVYTWSGEFMVPCRYGVDRLPAAIINRQPGAGELIVQCDAIPILEIRE